MDKRKSNGGVRANSGRTSVRDELKGFDLASPHVKESFDVVASIMKSKSENTRDRIAAAKLLIEYGCGKPKETVDQNVNINNFDLKEVLQFDNSK